ncbi:MAG: ATP-dependent DNA helicase PcrA [Thermoplasmata archaeon]|nr:MAG: ATP-dependent DNA helicase PcrA [Thermoplasmata archaeon]
MNLADLNPEQLKAVQKLDGPVLVLAGAGTGKTRVITYRIANLIEHGVKPERILAVTFTNKAADEMKERVVQLCGWGGNGVWISTFHAFALKVLRTEYMKHSLPWDFTIFDEVDQKNLMKQVLKELELEDVIKPRAALYYIDIAKGNLIDSESAEIYSFFEMNFSEELVRIYKLYQKKLRENNAKDFGDLLLDLVILFREKREILEKYQNHFQYILVDEYQDTNYAQYIIIKELAKKHRNICVVGDDDQAIYSWRGANIQNIRNFEKDWKDCAVFHLERNYRSTQKILDVATALISNASRRWQKKLWTENQTGEDVVLGVFEKDIDEAKGIATEILQLVDFGYDFKEIAVFYRMNSQSRIFEEIFRRYQIPYKIVGGVGFYERKEIKDIISYLLTIINPKDNWHIKRVINVPPRGIGKKTLFQIERIAKEKNFSFYEALKFCVEKDVLPQKTTGKIDEFINLIEHWRDEINNMPGFEFVQKVLSESGYLEMLEMQETYEAKERIANLQEFVNAVRSHHEEKGEDLREFLYGIALISEKDLPHFDEEGVTLMTLHLCKGLEFRAVFITGLEEGVLPYSDSLYDVEELEEERRLCYVGITRAKEILRLSCSKTRRLWGRWVYNFPSRFLKETRLIE